MTHATILEQALVLLGAVVLVVPLVQRLGLGSVPGYLLAGLLIGPSALDLFSGHEAAARLGEFGVVFLMFAIGIELSPQRLWLMRRMVFGLGGAQLFVTALALGALAVLCGTGAAVATVVGFGLALSSTALVIQLLAERRELASVPGRAALSVLLLQDVAVAPLVSLVYLLSDSGGQADAGMLPGLLRALALLALFVAVGRWGLHRVLPLLASSRNPDLLVATALLLVLGAAWLMHFAGFSMALGAFLAGVLLADSAFRHQVVADLHPFRGVLLGVFFLSVGMSLDLQGALAHAPLLAGLTAGFMTLKALLLAGAARVFGLSGATAVRVGLHLAQGGEFALVLFALAGDRGLLEPALQELLMQMLVLSLLFAPAGFRLGDWLSTRLGRRPHRPLDSIAIDPELERHVVVCGFGRVGAQLGNLLDAAGQRWVAADLATDRVELARLAGLPVHYGDTSRPAILHALRIEQAALAIVTLDDAEAAERCLHAIRHHAPECRVIARTADLAHARALQQQGATRAVPETAEYSLQLGLAGLEELGLPATRLQELETGFRQRDYERLLANRVGLPVRR